MLLIKMPRPISPIATTPATMPPTTAPSTGALIGGDGGGGGEASATVGTDSTVTPSAVEAAAAVARLEESAFCSVVAFVEAGTEMVAVMITLAAATLIVTSDLSTPAAVATACCRLEVSE